MVIYERFGDVSMFLLQSGDRGGDPNIGMFRFQIHVFFLLGGAKKQIDEGFTPTRSITCPLKINGWKMYLLLKYSLFGGHSLVFIGVKGLTRVMNNGKKRTSRMVFSKGCFFGRCTNIHNPNGAMKIGHLVV